MGLEVERKFLVIGDAWRTLGEPVLIRQGYLCAEPVRVVRVRTSGDRAWLTVKGIHIGVTRIEFEYPIPLRDASDMLDGFCERPILEKRRTRIPLDEVTWEVDEFLGENVGLIVAEVELRSPDQPVTLPEWIGAEITGAGADGPSAFVTWVGHISPATRATSIAASCASRLHVGGRQPANEFAAA